MRIKIKTANKRKLKGRSMNEQHETKQAEIQINGLENITGAEAILRCLVEEDVDTIFGYPGG
ncbi:MAG TPA: hypothetical protein PLP03_04880, partial [Bacteroidales bacterium]|nr:hypothetical protein [Bacteroidales bacterium]